MTSSQIDLKTARKKALNFKLTPLKRIRLLVFNHFGSEFFETSTEKLETSPKTLKLGKDYF